MIKKVVILALVACLSLVTLVPGLVQAQSEPEVLDSSAEVDFPFAFTFSLSVQSDVNITDIRLHYQVDQLSYAQVTSEAYVEFVPGTLVETSWTWDMIKTGGLPPGSWVDYWWTVTDENGNRTETTPVRLQFADNRYPWRSLTEGKVTIYWYQGEESFAQELMTAAEEALERLAEDTGAYLEEPIRVYIYASTWDLQGSMIYPQEWTGGAAFTRQGIIAIGIAPDDLSWGKRAMTHELTHLVMHQMTFNPYNDLPVWLDEGLAMYAEGLLGPGYTTYLKQAVAEGSLISVRSLSSPFSAYTGQSILSYAQSYSLVDFMISNYGRDSMLELLSTFRQGSSYDGALEEVYGFDMDGLDSQWQDYVSQQYQPTVAGEVILQH
ncbi:MAG: peptidase MA domain-containing protein [Dehalococcoidia bacterium]|nr:MAG: peptidase MA domain-containing protein [Dehalococcoidia bacterium]